MLKDPHWRESSSFLFPSTIDCLFKKTSNQRKYFQYLLLRRGHNSMTEFFSYFDSLLPTLPQSASRSLFITPLSTLQPSPSNASSYIYRQLTSSLIIRDYPTLHLASFWVHARYRKCDDDTNSSVTRTHLNWKCPRRKQYGMSVGTFTFIIFSWVEVVIIYCCQNIHAYLIRGEWKIFGNQFSGSCKLHCKPR